MYVCLFISILFVGECEQRITDLRARIPRQQETIRNRRTEKQRLEEEAKRLRYFNSRLSVIYYAWRG